MSFHSSRISFFGLCEDATRLPAKSRTKPFPTESAERDWFASALWRAFPGCRSENDLAEVVANHLRSVGRRASPRTVRNWLQREHAPQFRHVSPLLKVMTPADQRAYLDGSVR